MSLMRFPFLVVPQPDALLDAVAPDWSAMYKALKIVQCLAMVEACSGELDADVCEAIKVIAASLGSCGRSVPLALEWN